MVGTDLFHVGISNSKLRSQLASSLAIASAIIPDSIVDWTKIVYFLDSQVTALVVILKV